MPHRSQANKRRRYEGPLANGHRTIAILGASMASAYNAGVMLGAADYAKQHGYNVIVFAGGPLRNPDLVSQARDKIFDIIDPTMFSGMVLPLSSLSRYSNQAQIDRFLSPFRHLPIATIGSDFEDTISVSVHNQPGMFELC